MTTESTNTRFYISLPGENWVSPPYVIEARPFNPHIDGRYDYQKTQEFAESHLQIISPPAAASHYKSVKKEDWTECYGPARELDFQEYVALYHSIDPSLPLPETLDGQLTETDLLCVEVFGKLGKPPADEEKAATTFLDRWQCRVL